MEKVATQQDVIKQAKIIADSIYEKYNLEGQERNLLEVMQILNIEGYNETDETFFSCGGFLKEIACLLTDPKIAARITEEYYQKNGGKLLLKMMAFFDRLSRDEKLQHYLMYSRLKLFAGNATMQDIENIETSYLKQAV